MDKFLPLGSFKRFFMTRGQQIKESYDKREWGWLISYFVFVTLIAVVVIFAAIGAIIGGFEAIGIVRENISAPQRILRYERKSETKNEDGSYTTVFSIIVLTPPGKVGRIDYRYPQDCSDLVFITQGGELSGGFVWQSQSFESTCNSEKPIVDKLKNLFELRKK